MFCANIVLLGSTTVRRESGGVGIVWPRLYGVARTDGLRYRCDVIVVGVVVGTRQVGDILDAKDLHELRDEGHGYKIIVLSQQHSAVKLVPAQLEIIVDVRLVAVENLEQTHGA